MKLHKIERYVLDGQEFRDLKQVRTHIESQIGAILDSMPMRLPPKDALAVFDAITDKKNRARLCALLSVEIESEEWDGQNRNVLDF